MSANMDAHEHDPVANLHMQPVKGILKSTKSIDDAAQDTQHDLTHINQSSTTTGMTRSESKSHKIPHFDEMNIIATYHPPDKDYGHMKIEEPKTPYAPNDIIDEEMDTGATASGIDPLALAEKLNESKSPSTSSTFIRLQHDRSPRKSIDDTEGLTPEEIEHRKQFEQHRKQHYNEFEVVRLRRKEIEEELRALESEEQSSTTTTEQNKEHRTESIKPILVHHPHSRDSSASSSHHVHVDDGHQDDQTLTEEERERKKQFELKRKKHYNEFRASRMADKDDDDEQING